MPHRTVRNVLRAPTLTEGGGFKVRRPFPSRAADQIDPFLLLDEMGPTEYAPGEAVGAPDHPHRGFETVSYLLAGELVHEDSAGHRGHLNAGDVQWMTAGDGVVHSEEPSAAFRARGGAMHGFQIWVNLPSRLKRIAPNYQEIPAAGLPVATDGKVSVVVIAGQALGKRAVIQTQTPIVLLDFTIRPGGMIEHPVDTHHNAMIYVFGGALLVGERRLGSGDLGVLGPGDVTSLVVPASWPEPARFLFLSGVPLGEPMVRYGPFVMNSAEQIQEAFSDFQRGKMGRITRAPPPETAD